MVFMFTFVQFVPYVMCVMAFMHAVDRSVLVLYPHYRNLYRVKISHSFKHFSAYSKFPYMSH